MTPDQLARLNDLQNRLVETTINDADPINWVASGKLLIDMNAKERGDSAWCRKTAVQTVSLLIRVQQLLEPKMQSPTEAQYLDPEADIKKAERAARELMDRHAKTR